MLEVEVKAPCSDAVPKLLELGAEEVRIEWQEDLYFNSPWRDFRETDEALRVRRIDDRFFLTYKGPRIDSETKTREEIEISVDSRIAELLKKLGFSESGVVRKKRRIFRLEDLTVCFDSVVGLGFFIEVESRNLSDKEKIFRLLEKLGIGRGDTICKSYLELLEGEK